MSQLNNLFVSSSYQGLLKLTDSTNGLTNTLQYVQDGSGNNGPLQMSLTSMNLTGSIFINNIPVTGTTSGTSGTSGSSGSSGSDGSSGTSGSSGNGFSVKGIWTGTTTYVINDVVLYGGQSYVSIQNGNLNKQPSVQPAWWTLFSAAGTSGSSGSDGSSGTSGTNGSSGTSGSNGTNGSSGTSGSNGTNGSSGTSGSNGTDGSSGSNGTDGSSGTSGSNGTDGTSGDSLFAQTGSVWNTTNQVGITGSLSVEGQVNVSTNLNVTQSLNVNGNSTFNGQTTYNNTIQYNADSFIKSGSQINFNIGDGLDGQYYRLGRKVSGEFGIVQDPGNYHLLDISSSFATLLPKTSFTNGLIASGSNTITGSLDINGTLNLKRPSNTTINNITSSLINGGNILFDSPTNLTTTSSFFISGSNNMVLSQVFTAPTNRVIVNGSGNVMPAGQITLNTGSLLTPLTTNNYINGGSLTLTFTTSSVAGGQPLFNGNIINGGSATLNLPSGSISFSNNNINSTVTHSGSVTPFTVRPSFTNNLVVGSTTLNHISSSISSLVCSYLANGTIINNTYFHTGSANNVTFVRNTIVGQDNTINFGGNPTTNVARNAGNSIIGGNNNIVSMEQTGSSVANLGSTLIYGNGLVVTGSHSSVTTGGSTFVGRWNATGSLQDSSQDTVFVVGTGTAAGSRRNALHIDINNNTRITGSLLISGSVNVNGNSTLSGSLTIASGSGTNDLFMYGHKMFNVGVFYSTATQTSAAGVSSSVTYNTTDISQGVSVVAGSQLTLADAGIYNIQFSAQVLADTGSDDVWFWLKKNGTNIPDTAGRVTLANNEELMAAWNYVVSANAGDYIELVWQNSGGDAVLLYNAPTGNIPAVTSIITTVTQVR